MSTLVIAAHPDDETLGCGGTIAKLSSAGEKICIVILGQGIASRGVQNRTDEKQQIKTLREQSRTAAGILGTDSISFHDLPDNRFDTVPLLEVVRIIESYIKKIAPETIYTHHVGDLNIDHTITAKAAITAARPVPGCCVKKIFGFEVLSSTEWNFGAGSERFEPTLFNDITPYLDIKIKAMEAYENEICSFPHPRSRRGIKTLALQRGCMSGLDHCEAFSVIRIINAGIK